MCEESHIVKRAIIMAAGTGNRMHPLTLTTPKPLVKVNGVRMIDTVVDGLRSNGITEIYVVVGHLKEQFHEWAKEQPGVQIIENPYYDTCNNISSLYVAREHLGDCIILDEGETKEWLMEVQDGIVKSCSRTGGRHGWQLYSISRWSAEDGAKLRRHLEQEFEGGNRQIYWDDVAMFCHFSEYTLGIREMRQEDIIEIDDLEELVKADPSYESYMEAGN